MTHKSIDKQLDGVISALVYERFFALTKPFFVSLVTASNGNMRYWVLYKHIARQSCEFAVWTGDAKSDRKQKHGAPVIRSLILRLPAWSTWTALACLEHPRGWAAKPFSAAALVLQGAEGKGGPAGAGTLDMGLLGHPQAFLHAQLDSRHRGESRQVIAGRYVPVGSSNPRKP